MSVTAGQLDHERGHLLAKLAVRDPSRMAALPAPPERPETHPLLSAVPGPVEPWEIV